MRILASEPCCLLLIRQPLKTISKVSRRENERPESAKYLDLPEREETIKRDISISDIDWSSEVKAAAQGEEILDKSSTI